MPIASSDHATKPSLSWTTAAVVSVAAVTLGSIMASAVLAHRLLDVAPYDVTDNLISYAGGFMRRGLLGAVLYAIPAVNTMARVELVLKWLFASNFVLLSVMIGALVFRYIRSVSLSLLILLQPFLLAFPILTAEWTRKDGLLITAFYLTLTALGHLPLRDSANPRRARVVLLANLICIAAILTHEVYAIAVLPILIVGAAAKDHAAGGSASQSLRRAFIMFSPSMAAAILVSMFHGDPAAGRHILDAWRAKGVLTNPSALQFLVAVLLVLSSSLGRGLPGSRDDRPVAE